MDRERANGSVPMGAYKTYYSLYVTRHIHLMKELLDTGSGCQGMQHAAVSCEGLRRQIHVHDVNPLFLYAM